MQVEFMLWLQENSIPFLETIFNFITHVGSDNIYVFFVAWLYWCVDHERGEKWGYLILGSALLNGIIKLSIKAPRPFEAGLGITPVDSSTATGHSFPSGHSQASAVFGAFLALEYKKRLAVTIGVSLFILIGLSRLYLRVHWPVDVLAGWTLGIMLAFVWHKLYDRYPKRLKIGFIVVMVLSALFFRDADQIKLLGLSSAAMIGFEVNKRMGWAKVHPFGRGGKRKLLTGLLMVLGIMAGLKLMLPSSLNIVRYAAVGLTLSTAFPVAFEKFQSLLGIKQEG